MALAPCLCRHALRGKDGRCRPLPTPTSRIYVAVAAVGLTVMIGLSRTYLGVHWPSDVLAGWTFGGTWALLCWTILWRFAPARLERHN